MARAIRGPSAAASANIIRQHPIDVAFVGIGENGHLAFNDPPADFETEEPYLVVELDDACRRQQLGEGWFPTFDDVPQASDLDERPADHEEPGDHLHRARRAQSGGGAQCRRRRSHAGSAGLNPAAARACTLYLDKAAASQLGGEHA